ncbi:DNA-binding protein [Escherichia coli]|nr:DNA-binding protein [Escherichia coli]
MKHDYPSSTLLSAVLDRCSQRSGNGKLPRTEYTGETNYAEKIAHASNGLFSADAILTIGRNKTTTKKLMGVDS